MNEKLLLVVCKSFEKEILTIIDINNHKDISVIAYDSQCMQPKSNWDYVINLVKDKKISKILLFGCFNVIKKNLLPPEFQNCRTYKISCYNMLADQTMIDSYIEKGFFIITGGWLGSWKYTIENIWKFDKTTAQKFFKESCKELLFLDTGIYPDCYKQINEFSKFIGRSYQSIFVGLDHLRTFIDKLTLEYRLETELLNHQTTLNEKNRLKSNFAMMSHLMNEFPNEMLEGDLVRKNITLFNLILSPKNVFYLSYIENKASRFYSYAPVSETRKISIKKLLNDEINSSKNLIDEDDCFIIRIEHDHTLLGMFYIYKILFIENKNSYIEFISLVTNICALAIANSSKYEKIKKIQRKLEKVNKQLFELTTIDPLTNIANRRKISNFLEKVLKISIREKKPITIIMSDIDNFKQYNDTYGHTLGDKCLQLVANTLTNSLRRPSDIVGRYGGEEFIIILPDTDKQGALFIANNIRENLYDLKIEHSSSKVSKYVTMSFGVTSIYPELDISSKEIINYADKALYQAKSEGRDRIIYRDAEAEI